MGLKKELFILIAISMLLAFAPLLINIAVKIRKKVKKGYEQLHVKTLLLFLVFSLISFRYAVGLFSLKYADLGLFGQAVNFGSFEEFCESIFNAIQMVGLDADLSAHIVAARNMFEYLTDNAAVLGFFKFYVPLINVIAPAAGGVFILDILADFFPSVQLFFESLRFFKSKYIFSELNEESLVLAKNIINEKRGFFRSPTIIFTDVYIDDKNERSAEMFNAAKSMGAICTSDDILHIRCLAKRKYLFLIDEKEVNNVSAFAQLTSEECCRTVISRTALSSTDIFIFYQDDSYALTEKKSYERLYKAVSERYLPSFEKKAARKAKEAPVSDAVLIHMPAVKRIRCYQNLVYETLQKIPLFTPLNPLSSKELNVTVIGAGNIGTEMFLSSTWCGQLLNVKLSLNVLSDGSSDEFRKKIDNISPEILLSGIPESPILRVFPEGTDSAVPEKKRFSDRYFTFRYRQCDIKSEEIRNITFESTVKGDKTLKLTDSDYIFISIGSDEENIRAAEKIYNGIKTEQLCTGKNRNVVIVYVVYNSVLCSSLNSGNADENIKMYAIGSLEETYSYRNIFMEELDDLAGDYSAHYNSASGNTENNINVRKRTLNRYSKPYNVWSNIARAVHVRYRIFSAAVVGKTDISGKSPEDVASEYSSMLSNEKTVALLTWLEHRRWNGYIRSQGFRKIGTQKDVGLRIHTCLTECRHPEIHAGINLRDNLDLSTGDPHIKNYDSPMDSDCGDGNTFKNLSDYLKKVSR